jgi:sensor histidine kinase regulating citrate/malate metabolism
MMNKGIGIFIIYRLVSKVLKGSIKCESEENKGTRFIIKIPL